MFPLFAEFDQFPGRLPRVPLAQLPTPIERMERLGALVGAHNLYIKRDDLTGSLYGGNKLRKLEFLLGEAVRAGVKEVMTFGCAGSNHATATAIYAHELGLRSISMLLPQPNARSVRRNLLLSCHFGAELHHYASSAGVRDGVRRQMARHRRLTGSEPLIIPAGGSSALGAVGYVNAAFELAGQVEEGALTEPDVIYVAAGTLGTTVGLNLGLKAAGLKTRVIPVRVTGEKFVNAKAMVKLFKDTNQLLHDADRRFPLLEFGEEDTHIRHEFYGGKYAEYTQQSVEAMGLVRATEGIRLEGTYTGKAFAALLADARDGFGDACVVFWNTYNSRDLSGLVASLDYHRLPRAFHRYFEEEVQPLDLHTE